MSFGTFLMVQWLEIHLLIQGTHIWSLVQEDPTCLGATEPVCTATGASVLLLKPTCLEPVLTDKGSHHDERGPCTAAERSPHWLQLESPHTAVKTQHSHKQINKIKSVFWIPGPNVIALSWGGAELPHNTERFSRPSKASENSTQFWYSLPRNSIRSTGLRTQSHRTASPISDAVLLTNQLWVRVPITPCLGLINLLQGFRNPVSGTGSKTNVRTRDALSARLT